MGFVGRKKLEQQIFCSGVEKPNEMQLVILDKNGLHFPEMARIRRTFKNHFGTRRHL